MKIFKNKVKVSAEGYYKPTPSKWRKIGDTLLLASTTLSSLNIDKPYIAIAIQVTGVVGKFLTNFAHE
jgi:hypothetical protein